MLEFKSMLFLYFIVLKKITSVATRFCDNSTNSAQLALIKFLQMHYQYQSEL